MREIKFRVWDGKRMLTPYEINFNRYGISVRCKEVVETIKNPILLQYTGLKDRKGKEIYEGDIVYNEVFQISQAVRWFEDTTGYVPFGGGLGEWTPTLCEVIGNIYENKELL